MSNKIEIAVKYSADEYVRGMIFSQRKSSSHKISYLILGVSVLIGFIGVYYFINKGEINWNSDLFLKLLFALIIVIPITYSFKDFSLVTEMIFKKQYASTALLQETYQISFDAEGIHSESNSFANKLRWEAIIESVQTNEDLHFFIAYNASLFIPTRVFTDEQKNELKNLVEIKLGDKAKL
jgi:hypothetical protein